jgi:CRISPR system Cascade subunit CasE
MYLSRISLDREAAARMSRFAPLSASRSHGMVWSWFSDGAMKERDFLFRVDHEEEVVVWTLSQEPPAAPTPWRADSKRFTPDLRKGDRMHFLLRANPTFRAAGGEGKGKRHDVVMDAKRRARLEGSRPAEAEIVTPACVNWLAQRAARCGFLVDITRTRADRYVVERFARRREGTASLATVDLSGILEVTEPDLFTKAVASGIGPAKAFGCGLMLIKRA